MCIEGTFVTVMLVGADGMLICGFLWRDLVASVTVPNNVTPFSTGQDKTKKFDGFFEIQGLSDENDIDEVDIEITTKDTTNDGYKVILRLMP